MDTTEPRDGATITTAPFDPAAQRITPFMPVLDEAEARALTLARRAAAYAHLRSALDVVLGMRHIVEQDATLTRVERALLADHLSDRVARRCVEAAREARRLLPLRAPMMCKSTHPNMTLVQMPNGDVSSFETSALREHGTLGGRRQSKTARCAVTTVSAGDVLTMAWMRQHDVMQPVPRELDDTTTESQEELVHWLRQQLNDIPVLALFR